MYSTDELEMDGFYRPHKFDCGLPGGFSCAEIGGRILDDRHDAQQPSFMSMTAFRDLRARLANLQMKRRGF